MSDLRKYLALISKTKDVRTIKKQVSTKYEIAAITSKFDGHEALIFNNVKNSKLAIVSNLVGTRKRFAQAVGANPERIHQIMSAAIKICKKPKIVNSAKLYGKFVQRFVYFTCDKAF